MPSSGGTAPVFACGDQLVEGGDLIETERGVRRRADRDARLIGLAALDEDDRRQHHEVGVVAPIGPRHLCDDVADAVDRLGGGVHALRQPQQELPERRPVEAVGHVVAGRSAQVNRNESGTPTMIATAT
ncbi:hypothetical protein JM654_16450 [Microbacterium oxydans]|nr:hypothetical protein [Microbacterium oxydans]